MSRTPPNPKHNIAALYRAFFWGGGEVVSGSGGKHREDDVVAKDNKPVVVDK